MLQGSDGTAGLPKIKGRYAGRSGAEFASLRDGG
jgi:hypothetical protein